MMARTKVSQNDLDPGSVDFRFRGNDRKRCRGFSMVEILASLAVLTAGLLFMLAVLQRTLQKGEPLEFEPRAGLLAESILEALRAHPDGGIPFVPGLNVAGWPVINRNTKIYSDGTVFYSNGKTYQIKTPFVFSIPGNGVDDDALLTPATRWRDEKGFAFPDKYSGPQETGPDGLDDTMYSMLPIPPNAVRAFRIPGRLDFDGGAEQEVANGLLGVGNITSATPDTDHDGIWADSGDSYIPSSPNLNAILRADGDFFYDPQRGIDEELPDGKDNDGDGFIDEDTMLASQLVYKIFRLNQETRSISPIVGNPYYYDPLAPGNGLDDDEDSKDYEDRNHNNRPDPLEPGVNSEGRIYADEIDNNGDGKIDEGIDEEIFDGISNDNDTMIDEDCQGAYLPWQPIPFPSPNEEYSFRIMVRRVAAGGDGIDNDGDANFPHTLDRIQNVGQFWWEETPGVDEEVFDGADNDNDGLTDEDLRAYPAPRQRLVTVFVYQGDNRKDDDGDGWVDEEAKDGIDNDLDGKIDEDVYRRVYRTTGLIELPE
jgi:hypothetical protein